MTTPQDNPQFMHIESYARTASRKAKRTSFRSAANIVDELMREPHASPHVPHPRSPEILWGDPAAALALSLRMADVARDPRGRKLRRDAHVLAGCICSYPVPVKIVEESPEEQRALEEWTKKSCEWAFEQYGRENVGAIVRHMDETMPHLHIIVTPPAPGVEPSPLRRAAKAASRGTDDKKKRRTVERRAFLEAAKRLQDSYFKSVSVFLGHTRHGFHQRKRMTRKEREIENSQARALRVALEEAEKVQALSNSRLNALKERETVLERRDSELAEKELSIKVEQKRLTSDHEALAAQRHALLAKLTMTIVSADTIAKKLLASVEQNLSPSARAELVRAYSAAMQTVREDAGFTREGGADPSPRA